MADRQGAIAGKATAERFGWKVGDRIPIKGAGYPGDWEFNLRGIYTGRRPNDDLTQFWFQWIYLREKGPEYMRDYIGWYTVRLEKGANPAAVARDIDALFENSAFATRSQSESAFMQGFVTQFGNIQFLLLSIGGVVFFTLLLVTGNTMAMSVRERTGELAVLKTVGFTDGFVLGLVLVETRHRGGGGRGPRPRRGQALEPPRRPHGRHAAGVLHPERVAVRRASASPSRSVSSPASCPPGRRAA